MKSAVERFKCKCGARWLVHWPDRKIRDAVRRSVPACCPDCHAKQS